MITSNIFVSAQAKFEVIREKIVCFITTRNFQGERCQRWSGIKICVNGYVVHARILYRK